MAASEKVVKVGQWGDKSGTSWSLPLPEGQRYTQITINYGERINSIHFSYSGKNNTKYQSERFGAPGVGNEDTINFDPDEYITEIYGSYGDGDKKYLTSFGLNTNNKQHGPYGTNSPHEFSITLESGSFVGFFGYNGDHVNSIGAMLAPPKTSAV